MIKENSSQFLFVDGATTIAVSLDAIKTVKSSSLLQLPSFTIRAVRVVVRGFDVVAADLINFEDFRVAVSCSQQKKICCLAGDVFIRLDLIKKSFLDLEHLAGIRKTCKVKIPLEVFRSSFLRSS